MLPARFDYHQPDSVDEATALLGQYGDDAKILAGGMSLIPLMKLRFATPGHLIDVNRIGDLAGIAEDGGRLVVGAVTHHADLERSDLLKSRYPTMAEAAPQISDPIVRNVGTIGGSLAHGDPAGDWGSVMLALNGEVVARSASGERVIAADDLFISNFATSLRPDELITQIRIPSPQGRFGGAYTKLERKVGDFATVAVAVHLTLDDGRIGSAGIALTSVGPRNIKVQEAEASLAGAEPIEEAFAEAARLAGAAAQPITDVRGSADYKRHVVEVFTRRGLARALENAQAA